MITYTYLCDKCGEYEVPQRIIEDKYKFCVYCASGNVTRLISNTNNPKLIGHGFYKPTHMDPNVE